MPTGDRTYTPELAELILGELESGKSLNRICKEHRAILPARPTIISWVNDDVDGFADKYAKARLHGYEAMSEELLDIADDGSNDFTEFMGQPVVRSEHIARSRLRVYVRQWLLSKALPKIYGDKLDVTSNGEKTSTIVLTSGASSACADLKDSE